MSILIHPNHWIQAFQLHPWPRVCKIKHQGMQTVATNTCERINQSEKLSEFHLDRIENLLLLNIPQSTVSGIISEWEQW